MNVLKKLSARRSRKNLRGEHDETSTSPESSPLPASGAYQDQREGRVPQRGQYSPDTHDPAYTPINQSRIKTSEPVNDNDALPDPKLGPRNTGHRYVSSVSSQSSSHPIADEVRRDPISTLGSGSKEPVQYTSSAWYRQPNSPPRPSLGVSDNDDGFPGVRSQPRNMAVHPSTRAPGNVFGTEEASDVSILNSSQPQTEPFANDAQNSGTEHPLSTKHLRHVDQTQEFDPARDAIIRHEPDRSDLRGDFVRQSNELSRTGISSHAPTSSFDKPLPYTPERNVRAPVGDDSTRLAQSIHRKPVADRQGVSVLDRPRAVSTQKYTADLPERTPFDKHRQAFDVRPGRQTIYNPSDVIRSDKDLNLVTTEYQNPPNTSLQSQNRGTSSQFLDSGDQTSSSTEHNDRELDAPRDVSRQSRDPEMLHARQLQGQRAAAPQKHPASGVEPRPLSSRKGVSQDQSLPEALNQPASLESHTMGRVEPETLPDRPETITHGPRAVQRAPSFDPNAPEPISLTNVLQPGHQQIYHRPAIIKDSAEPPSLEGVVDLSNTQNTSIDTNWAKPVIHDEVHPVVHHVHEEVYTREYHTDHYYHRILPVIDVKVLPAKHIAPMGPNGEYVEVPAAAVAGRSTKQTWFVGETASKIPTGQIGPVQPRRFTARNFDGEEFDDRHWVDNNGIERSEQTWVYPPVIDEGAKIRGLTEPVDIGLDEQETNHLSHGTLTRRDDAVRGRLDLSGEYSGAQSSLQAGDVTEPPMHSRHPEPSSISPQQPAVPVHGQQRSLPSASQQPQPHLPFRDHAPSARLQNQVSSVAYRHENAAAHHGDAGMSGNRALNDQSHDQDATRRMPGRFDGSNIKDYVPYGQSRAVNSDGVVEHGRGNAVDYEGEGYGGGRYEVDSDAYGHGGDADGVGLAR